MVALSFVRTGADLTLAHEIMDEVGPRLRVPTKLEAQAVDDLDEIVTAFDGLMVARDDLGVETPLEKVPAGAEARGAGGASIPSRSSCDVDAGVR